MAEAFLSQFTLLKKKDLEYVRNSCYYEKSCIVTDKPFVRKSQGKTMPSLCNSQNINREQNRQSKTECVLKLEILLA